MKFAFIEEHRQELPVRAMCNVFRVTPAGYYAWRDRPASARQQRRDALLAKIQQAHEASDGTYGSPRVHRDLEAQGERCSVNTVAKLMRENDVVSCTKRKFRICTTDSNHAHPVAANVLDRKFSVPGLDQVWTADITYIPTDEGWLYLAVVMDLCSRRIIGWSMADHLRAELTCDALKMALQQRRPDPQTLQNLVHHSDRGVQYACQAYQSIVSAHGITPSMSRRGNCYDNAPMESFMGSLKRERVHHERYATHAQARASLFQWIEVFYNRKRRHSAIGYISPVAFENRLN